MDRNINRILKKVIEIIEIPNDERYHPHAFRRGSAQVVGGAGSQWSVLVGSGGWGSLALNGYVDLIDELPQDIAKLFVDHYDFVSVDEADVHCVRESRSPPRGIRR